jgi:hypothetical protein
MSWLERLVLLSVAFLCLALGVAVCLMIADMLQ